MSSNRQPAPIDQQPKSFSFSEHNLTRAKEIIARYPTGRQASAVMPLLDLAQRQHDGWLPQAAMNYVAHMLEIPRIRAYEVATFYTMYNLAPVGRHVVQVCTTTPCRLRGSDEVLDSCRSKLGLDVGETSKDKEFTLLEVECLGACVNAPVAWIDDDYYEDLNSESMENILDKILRKESVKPGSQSGRNGRAPSGERTTVSSEEGS